ncbi:hypothetical protein LVJ94_21860 [Pendulispora rubella]|uniref:CAAX prenyl protease 2/Lysostaphin resistance protein A-like domain-containing protein n=1 Tax=Pendulispora rubella TaxID=2741070 RepID=A0ABZ2LG18_9BACT
MTAAKATKPLAQVAKPLASALALQAGILLVGALLHRNAMGASAVQAAAAEFGAGQFGVAWSDPLQKAPTSKAIVLRALRGAGYALGLAVLLVGSALLTRAASFHGAAHVGVLPLVNGLIVSVLLAVRDELILRGMVLRALDGAVPRAVELVVCGLVAAAAVWGSKEGAAPALEIVAAGVFGAGFAVLWKMDRGAWMAWGANATFHYVMTTLTHGAVFDVRVAQGSWAQAVL